MTQPTRRLVPLSLALVACLALARGAAAQVSGPDQLHYPSLPSFTIPQPERVVLDNGMVVLLLPDHELPLIEVSALVTAGPRYDPPGQVGRAALGAELLRTGGTTSRSGDQVDDYLESHAATIELSADDDLLHASASALAGDFPGLLSLLADMLRHPAFDAARLEVARTQALAAVARQNDDPNEVLQRETRKLVYGADSPYARTPTYATLRAIGRDDVLAWQKAQLYPERVVLGVVGDFQRDEALARVRAAFGDWQRGAAVTAVEVPRRQPTAGVHFARKDDVTQSYVALAQPGAMLSDPELYPLEVLDQLFSGGFASRLFVDVRTRRGLAYDVWGGIGWDWDHPGVSGLFLSTKVESTRAAVEALLAQARGLTANPPTASEVERARKTLLDSFVFRFDSPAKVMRRQLLLEHYHYPPDWLARYRQGVEGVTVDGVRQAARRLRPEELTLLVVGPAGDTAASLAAFGTVQPLDISLPEPVAPSP